MLIIGAKGFAKEVLEIFHKKNQIYNLAFYDDVNSDIGNLLFTKFPILKREDQVKEFFINNGFEFTIAIGNPQLRYKLYKKFFSLKGNFTSCISSRAIVGSYGVKIMAGCNILDNAIISNSSFVGKGCIVYYNATITHDCIVHDFVELSPGATLLGGCEIGSFSQIGSNATILPNIKIGENVIIGAGSVVNKNIPNNSVAVGVPAKIIKQTKPDS